MATSFCHIGSVLFTEFFLIANLIQNVIDLLSAFSAFPFVRTAKSAGKVVNDVCEACSTSINFVDLIVFVFVDDSRRAIGRRARPLVSRRRRRFVPIGQFCRFSNVLNAAVHRQQRCSHCKQRKVRCCLQVPNVNFCQHHKPTTQTHQTSTGVRNRYEIGGDGDG